LLDVGFTVFVRRQANNGALNHDRRTKLVATAEAAAAATLAVTATETTATTVIA
jgi:hypothetical protein